jgi:16S rRNA (guanine966-N2)-methyltransferase
MRIGAGRFKNATLPAADAGVRPVPARLRTSLFSVLGARVDGARVLDLCAGVGGLGLEALSRGAARVVLVDEDPRAVAALSKWIAARGAAGEASAVVADAERGGWPFGPYDVVFLDPPFSTWDDVPATARFLATAVAAASPHGIVVVKLPATVAVPEDPRWKGVDRRAQGTVAYALVRPVRTAPPDQVPPPLGRFLGKPQAP